jgi:hypothetical protein
VAFHEWGHPLSAYDLALIWDMETDEWLRMPYGALGKDGPRDMLALSETEWILEGEQMLYRVRDPRGQLRRKRRNILEPPAWSEAWPEEDEPVPERGAPAPPGGLLGKIFSLFR